MSISANIDIHLSKVIKKHRSAIEIIQELTDFGWTLSLNGYVGYLPLGDTDNFDWKEEKITVEVLNEIIKEKIVLNEVVGVIMTWENTGIGGTFLFWTDEKYETFSMNTSINRQEVVLEIDYKITDFQWYLPKLLVPLDEIWGVEYFSFYHHI